MYVPAHSLITACVMYVSPTVVRAMHMTPATDHRNQLLQHAPYRCGPNDDLGLCVFGKDLIRRDDSKSTGDSLLEYCRKEACCAPLEQAAAASVGLGLLLTASEDVSPACLSPDTCDAWPVCNHQQYTQCSLACSLNITPDHSCALGGAGLWHDYCIAHGPRK